MSGLTHKLHYRDGGKAGGAETPKAVFYGVIVKKICDGIFRF